MIVPAFNFTLRTDEAKYLLTTDLKNNNLFFLLKNKHEHRSIPLFVLLFTLYTEIASLILFFNQSEVPIYSYTYIYISIKDFTNFAKTKGR